MFNGLLPLLYKREGQYCSDRKNIFQCPYSCSSFNETSFSVIFSISSTIILLFQNSFNAISLSDIYLAQSIALNEDFLYVYEVHF